MQVELKATVTVEDGDRPQSGVWEFEARAGRPASALGWVSVGDFRLHGQSPAALRRLAGALADAAQELELTIAERARSRP